MAHLALSFLGGFSVILDAQPITLFGSDKVRALLVYLCLEASRPHRRGELAAMFWPELAEKKASHNLSQSLLRLRQALQEKKSLTPFLTVTSQDVQFNEYSDYQLDVTRFRELLNLRQHHQHTAAATCPNCAQWLTQAAELYRGDLLAGFFVPDSVAFAEWRLLQQEELHRQALETLIWLATYHEQKGEFEQAQKYARRQIVLEPWREEAHIQLMKALAQSGRTAAALQQYDIYQQTLAAELGLSPSAQVTALYEQIRAGNTHQVMSVATQEKETTWLSQQGERRQVTILACNRGILNSAEGLAEPTTHCAKQCELIFHRFGGHRAMRQGNACLVYFGYPQAYEDAARRAVHSGLAVAAATSDHYRAQIGIHTGPIIVGEKRGPRWHDRDLSGAVFDIARDCQRLAQPGEVIVTEATQRLLQESFDVQTLPSALPGVAGQPLSLYRVRGESSLSRRLDWLAQTQRLTTFLGREVELRQLQTAWEKTRRGAGQVILLRGGAGLGKSRLLWEFAPHTEQATSSPVLRLTAYCLPHQQNNSLYPVVNLLEQMLGFQAEDNEKVRQEKLVKQLQQYNLETPSAVWVMTLLLGLSTGAPPVETITKAQREQMRKLFVALLQKKAAEQPVVLMVEDLHWSDPSTVEWLGQSLNSFAAAACLTLLTARPPFDPLWLLHQNERTHLLLLSLNPLPLEQAEQMVVGLTGEQQLPDPIRRHIVNQTDGIPLYIEELTKAVLEQPGAQKGNNLTIPVPPTLLDSLVARLDHLGTAKETAQWLATLGRDVSYALLRACVPYDESRLQSDLGHLLEAELVSRLQPDGRDKRLSATSSTFPCYTFKHALLQEAAYSSMLQHTRQLNHRRISETLAHDFPQLAATNPALMAHHAFHAGLPDQAADFWIQAGEQAIMHGATLEAKIFFDRALEAITPEDEERRWRALWGRETVFFFRGERTAQESDLMALRALAEKLNDDARRAQVFIRQARYATAQANYQEQFAAAELAIAAASRAGATTSEVEALAYKITALMRSGERRDLPATVNKTLALVQKISSESIRAYAMAAIALYCVETGDLVGAAQHLTQSLEACQRAPTRRLDLESQYYGHLGFTYAQMGLYPEARAALATGLELATLMGIGRYQAYHWLNDGFVVWRMGDVSTAIAREKQVLAEYQQSGELFGAAACQAYLGYMYEMVGDLAQAEKYLAEAEARFAAIGVELEKLEARATAARVALHQGQREKAQRLAQEVWAYLRQHGTEGFNSPSWLYLCLADVLAVLEIPGLALAEVLESGYHDLRQRADKLNHSAWRHAFLENVAENKALVERWNSLVRAKAHLP